MGNGSIGERVRTLIERSGSSQADFARHIGLDASKLSKSLTGARKFSSLDLARIAEYTGTTVDELLGVASAEPELAARAVAVEESAVARAITAARRYTQVRADLEWLRPRSMPPVSRPNASTRGRLVDQGERLAAQALLQLPTQEDALERDLAAVVEQYFGIDVAVEQLPSGFDGLAWRDRLTELILVGTSRSPGRQRFTIAHELGHLLAGDQQDLHVDEDVFSNGRDRTEMRVNSFAAAFLMPRELLTNRAAEGVSDQQFARLCEDFSVTPASMAWRLLNIGCIDAMQRERLGSQTALAVARTTGRSLQFAQWMDAASTRRVPARLIGDLLDAYVAGDTTLRPLASLLDTPVDVLSNAIGDNENQIAL